MLIPVVTMTFLLFALVSPLSHTATPPRPTELTAEQVREDIRFLQRTVMENHPDISFSTDTASLEHICQQLAANVHGNMSRDDVWRHVATVNPLLADGHLFVGYADWRADARAHLKAGGGLFPFELTLNNGKLIIDTMLGGAATPLHGMEIVTIDGVSAEQVMASLLTRMHGDTPQFRSALLVQRWWFYHWKTFGVVPHYQLTIARGSDIRSIEVPAGRSLPLALEASFEQQFRFIFQPDGTAVLTIDSFAPDDRARFLAFTRDAFAKLHAAGSPLLLIDVSMNGGGDDPNWIDGLMPYLAARPYRTGSSYRKRVNAADADPGEVPGEIVTGSISTWKQPQPDNPLRFTGQTQVVIGSATYSSAVLFANVMRDFGFATLTGTGGAARRSQSGGVRQFLLPHSKLALWVPSFVLDPPAGVIRGSLLTTGNTPVGR